MHDRFSTVRWLAFLVFVAGFVCVFVTQNVRMQFWFNLAALALICLDTFALAPRQTYSMLGSRDEAKPKVGPSALMGMGLVFLTAALIYHSQIRVSAVLMMSGMCLLALDRYLKATSISASK